MMLNLCIQINMMRMLFPLYLTPVMMQVKNMIKLNTQRLLQQVSKINGTSHGKGNSPSSGPKKGKRSNKERRKKWRSRREKRKRCPLSSSSAESENEIVDKNFKIIPKWEKFKWNLPSSMADYATLHFKNYIPDKDINEKILTENPVPSNLREVPVLDDSMKTLLVSQTTISTNHQMEKF